jgi:gliding motility-associated lipoprotein GldB
MLINFSPGKLVQRCAFIYIFLLINSCTRNPQQVDVSGVAAEVRAERFDQDLFLWGGENISQLKNKYGTFFDLFCFKLTQLGTPDTTQLKARLKDFISDADLKEIFSASEKIVHDFTPVDRQLTDAFKHYKYYFPQKIIPKVITFISGFNYGIVAADSSLGIGLDMYLGSDSKYYPALQFPHYKIKRMSKEYIPVDCMRAWGQSEWEQDAEQNDFLSQMIYYGKIFYFLDAMMPDAADTLKTGFTAAQLKWCDANEKNTWSFFIDQKLLFSVDQNQIAKFLNDGPTTSGFPKESPGAAAQWIGWKMVQSYMRNNPSETLNQLMNNHDYRKILNDSKYKPDKS